MSVGTRDSTWRRTYVCRLPRPDLRPRLRRQCAAPRPQHPPDLIGGAQQPAGNDNLVPVVVTRAHGSIQFALSCNMHETDHTASQGALAYDQAHGPLLAVNTESKTIAVFRIHGDRLTLSQILPSGGDFPVSVGVHGDHAYVLNALGGGPLYGYRVVDRRLTPIPCAHRRSASRPRPRHRLRPHLGR